jgi:hypothetical protein
MPDIQQRSHFGMLAARVFQGHRQSEPQTINDGQSMMIDNRPVMTFVPRGGLLFLYSPSGLCYKSRG